MTTEKRSRAPFWMGCGIGCLLLLGLVIGAAITGVRIGKKRYDEWKVAREVDGSDFVARGFHRVSGSMLQITERTSQPTVYVGEIVSIAADADADIAIVALSAEIRAKIAGNVHFRGQMLSVHPGGLIEKDLDVRASLINLLGEVKGQVRGTYTTLNRAPVKVGLPDRPKEP